MILATRSKFWWPRIKEEIKIRFHQCEACLVNAPSKPELPYNNGVPDDLTMISPNEVVSQYWWSRIIKVGLCGQE